MLEFSLSRIQHPDSRHHAEHLPATAALAADRLGNDHRVEGCDVRPYRQPVDGRRGNQAEVAHARQRHVERAWNRGRGEREYMDLGAEGLETFLLRHPEVLLFVDHQEPQVGKANPVSKQRVSSHHDAKRSVREAPAEVVPLRNRGQPGQLTDRDAGAIKA